MDKHGIRYAKNHNFRTHRIVYVVHHPALQELDLYPVAQHFGASWSVSDPQNSTMPEFCAPTRARAAVKAVEYALSEQAGQIVMNRILELFGQLATGSTLWQLLAHAVQESDNQVSAGLYPAASMRYWTEAWDRYRTEQARLSPEDRRLAAAYDLDDLSRCAWCGNRLLDPYLLDDDPYHPACAQQTEREQDR